MLASASLLLPSASHHHEDVRAHILEVATKLFAERGDALSMRQLAREIGYTATTIYLYFDNKQDLLFAVVDAAFAQFSRVIREARERHDAPRDQLVDMGWSYLEFAISHPHHYRLMFVQQPEFLTEIPADQRQCRIGAFDALAETVRDGLGAKSRTREVQRTADAIWSAVHGLVMLHLSMPSEFDVERTKRAMGKVVELTGEILP